MPEHRSGDANQRGGGSVLDRMAARFVALLVLLAAGAMLAWIHREDLLPRPPATVAADDPVAVCVAERSADIDKMRRDGVIDADRATLFKSRAEALCQAQFGQGSGPPGLPN
jgi:hypothetical protein